MISAKLPQKQKQCPVPSGGHSVAGGGVRMREGGLTLHAVFLGPGEFCTLSLHFLFERETHKIVCPGQLSGPTQAGRPAGAPEPVLPTNLLG